MKLLSTSFFILSILCQHTSVGMDLPSLKKQKSNDSEKLSQSEGFFKIYSWQDVKKKIKPDLNNFDEIKPNLNNFDTIKDEVIVKEKKHSEYNAFYHACSFQNYLLIQLHTNLSQEKYNWLDNNFYLLRNPNDFFNKNISIQDFLEQSYFKDFLVNSGSFFDHTSPFRQWLLATNTSFVGSTYSRGESTISYLLNNKNVLEITEIYLLYKEIFKLYNPLLFGNPEQDPELAQAQELVQNYIFTKIKQLATLVESEKIKSGILFQIMIPTEIVDDCSYMCTSMGTPITTHITDLDDGWDTTLGCYTKTTPFLKLLQTDPFVLDNTIIYDKYISSHRSLCGRKKPNINSFFALEVIQARLLLKQKYFDIELDQQKRLKNNTKMYTHHAIQPNLFQTIQDSVHVLARTIMADGKARGDHGKDSYKKKYLDWFDSSNIQHEMKREYDRIKNTKYGIRDFLEFAEAGIAFTQSYNAAQEALKSDDWWVRTPGFHILLTLLKHKAINIEHIKKLMEELIAATSDEKLKEHYQYFADTQKIL